jgi:hypothetical protein
MMMVRRAYRRMGWRLIEALIRHFRWHNTALDTRVPNVPFLKVKSLTVVNGYGQEHQIRTEERMAA